MNQVTEKLNSKTLWQSVVAAALWALANAQGAVIPAEVLIAIVGGIAVKEAAGKVGKAPAA